MPFKTLAHATGVALRSVLRALTAPTEEERKREAAEDEPLTHERRRQARRAADAHFRARTARRRRANRDA